MSEQEDVKRGMYDNEYFGIKAEQETASDQSSEQTENLDLAEETEMTGDETAKKKKCMICKTQAEVFICFLLCAGIAIAGIFSYAGRQETAESGQPAELQADTDSENSLQMPSLLYADKKEANLQLEALELQIQESETESTDVAEGLILKQEPKAGSMLSKSEIVSVTVSKGSGFVVVPNVCSQTKETACALLKESKLSFQVEEVFSDNVEAGIVVSQSVSADEKVPKDSVVIISVSKGAEKKEVPPEKSKKTQTAPPAKTNQPSAPAAVNEQPEPQAPAQPDEWDTVPEENVSDDWGSTAEEDISGDW